MINKHNIDPLKGEENYIAWSIRIEAILDSERLIDAIRFDYTKLPAIQQGQIPNQYWSYEKAIALPPDQRSPDCRNTTIWSGRRSGRPRRSTSPAIAEIGQNELAIPSDRFKTIDQINRDVLLSIKLSCKDGPLFWLGDTKSAYQAWIALATQYRPKGFTTEFLILKKLFNSHLGDFDSIHDYLIQIRRLLVELASLGIDFPKQIVFA
jgi:hypothetical protein